MADHEITPAKYDVAKVEAAILMAAAELHPEHTSTGGLLLKVLEDPDDRREFDTAMQAISSLCEFGLLVRRDYEIVEPTPAALKAVELLT